MPVPAAYDPSSPDEQPVPRPIMRMEKVIPEMVFFYPLTRRGHGPGLIVFLPPYQPSEKKSKTSLDPSPEQKWTEEGFGAIATVINDHPEYNINPEKALNAGITKIKETSEVDVKDKVAVLIYDYKHVDAIVEATRSHPEVVCVVVHGAAPTAASSIPVLVHVPEGSTTSEAGGNITTHVYTGTSSPSFVIPSSLEYHAGSAGIAHTRTLVFLRKHLGGPYFDLEAIWDEHCKFEFAERSVAKTMATMVEEPYVNHIPTMTGGIGREALTTFYRDHFIFSNPANTRMEPVSRTVGPDRIVDEFVMHMTHDTAVDWLLPGVPPTGKDLALPMVSVVNVRGDRLCHEHIWWDQATALLQVGVLPATVPHQATGQQLRLPVAGPESARLLVDEADGESNAMLGPGWGLLG